MKLTTSVAALAATALLGAPAQAQGWSDWWNGGWGGWGNGGGWGHHDDDDDHGWGGWGDWGNDDDDPGGDYCDDDHGWGGWGGWGHGDDDCDVDPPTPTGVPEIDGDLLGAGLLLLIGGGLVLTSRTRLG